MKFLLASLIALSAFSAFSAENCDNAESNYEMKICQSKLYDKADKRLNDLYGRVMKKLSKEEQASLKKAQRAWIAFRDAECDFQAGEMRGGTGEGLIMVSCMTTLTEKRSEDLQDVLEFR